ncbi:MAG TPA: hypothetical protein VGC20_00150 [bacterium]
MQIDERRAKQLHYEVMGIALAIRGHAGESGLYQEIDAALTDQDWRKMAIVQHAFEMLSTQRQTLILSEIGDLDEVGRSITLLERGIRMMSPAPSERSA